MFLLICYHSILISQVNSFIHNHIKMNIQNFVWDHSLSNTLIKLLTYSDIFAHTYLQINVEPASLTPLHKSVLCTMLWSLQMTFNTRHQYHWPQIYTQNVQMMHTVRAMSALRAKLLMTQFQFLNSGNKSFMIYFFHRWFQTEFHIPPIHMELCYICLSHIQLRARYDF